MNVILLVFIILIFIVAFVFYIFTKHSVLLYLIGALAIIPIGVLLLNYIRYQEYKLWSKCLRIKFGNIEAEWNFDFGPALKGNFDRTLGKIIYDYRPLSEGIYTLGFKIFENGFSETFFFCGDGLREAKRWQDIEHVYTIPRRYKTWVQIETIDLKVTGFWVTKNDIDRILAVLKDRIGDRWNEVFVGELEKVNVLKHRDLEKYLKMARAQS
ncbi:MAG: hypothetical protein AB1779_06895 [Candidatus Thermoplasmatota archaeon]